MDNRKIAVIAQCGEAKHSAIRSHLDEINVPQGYEVELIEVPSGGAVAATYQHAMETSDAKYKVYLSSGSILLRPSFFHDMLQLFVQDPSIGVMGLVGTEQLSTTGMLENSAFLKGKFLFSDGNHFDGVNIEKTSEDVMVVGGYLIATQYDIPWRKDLFHTNCLWAEAQCIEFKRKGYRVVVPKQEEAWLLVSKSEVTYDEASLEIFLDTYSKDIYPLVSIIIPTYQRPHYFRLALDSVLAQTYRNLDIFITDNSHNKETADMMQSDFSDDPRIHYEHHPEFDATGNWLRARAYDNPHAKYVNWLMDDDLFLPSKIGTMMDCFFANPDLSIVTSYRRLIDAHGVNLPDFPFSRPVASQNVKINGASAGRSILLNQVNFIGEPTTALVRKSLLLDGHDLGWTGREGKYLISDFPMWLRLLEYGNLFYLVDPLSLFRFHDGSDQMKPISELVGFICWALMIQEAVNRKVYLKNKEDRQKAILLWLNRATRRLRSFFDMDMRDSQELRDFLDVISAMTQALGEDGPIVFDIDTTLHRMGRYKNEDNT